MRKIVICSTAACSHLASRASSSPARVRWVLHSGRLEGKQLFRETAPGLGIPSQIFHAKWHIHRETPHYPLAVFRKRHSLYAWLARNKLDLAFSIHYGASTESHTECSSAVTIHPTFTLVMRGVRRE